MEEVLDEVAEADKDQSQKTLADSKDLPKKALVACGRRVVTRSAFM